MIKIGEVNEDKKLLILKITASREVSDKAMTETRSTIGPRNR